MSEQRKFARIPAENVVLVTKHDGRELDSFVKASSVSLGGVGFVSDEPLGIGSVIELMISVRPRVVKAHGKIAYENRRDDGKVTIGVEFLQLDEEDQSIIEDLLEQVDDEDLQSAPA